MGKSKEIAELGAVFTQDGGNVGIGTTSPTELLDVAGKVNISTGLAIGPAVSGTYAEDSTLSSYATNNGVYLNGHSNGWLRLNGDGSNRASIDIYGQGYAAPWNDAIVFKTGGTGNRMMIANNGNIGINTTSPSAPLHINSDTEHQIKVSATSAAGASMQLETAGGYSYQVFTNSSKSWRMGAYGGSSFQLLNHTDSITPLTVLSDGRVGIGTTTPNTKLHILSGSSGGSLTNAFEITDTGYTNIRMLSGGADGEIKVGAAGQLRGSYKAQYAGTSGSYNFNIGTNNTNAITIDTSQNVGIGTTNPAQELHVHTASGNADLRLTGDGQTANYMDVFSGSGRSGLWIVGSTSRLEFGTNNTERMRLDHEGRVTKPYQPAFLCRPPAAHSIIAGEHTVTGTWSSEYNIGNHFNTSNGQFTAPVAGVYAFSWAIFASGSLGTRSDAWIAVNGTPKLRIEIGSYNSGTTNRNQHVHGQLKISANDVVTFGTYQNNNCTIYSTVSPWSYAAGYLLG